jgi:hypothetical protein
VAWNTALPGIGPVVKVSGNISWHESAGWPPVLSATGWNVNGFDLPGLAHELLCDYFGRRTAVWGGISGPSAFGGGTRRILRMGGRER